MNDLQGDIHALSGAYAIDALDDLERARFTRHLAECSECHAEVDSLREAAATLPELTALTPSDQLRSRILAEISTVRPMAPITAEEAEPAPAAPPTSAPGRPGRPWLRGLVAAAAVAAVLGAGGAILHPWDNSTSQSPSVPSAAERVMNAGDAQQYTQRLSDGGEATIVTSKSMNKFVLITKNLPRLKEGTVYEMWLKDAQKGMVPAGLMTAEDGTVVLDGNVANAVAAGITVEPAGGSHVPTTDPIALISFENA